MFRYGTATIRVFFAMLFALLLPRFLRQVVNFAYHGNPENSYANFCNLIRIETFAHRGFSATNVVKCSTFRCSILNFVLNYPLIEMQFIQHFI